MEDFAHTIMCKCRHNKMSALQYLEHCIRQCYLHRDTVGVDKFANVRDFIEERF